MENSRNLVGKPEARSMISPSAGKKRSFDLRNFEQWDDVMHHISIIGWNLVRAFIFQTIMLTTHYCTLTM